MLGEYRKYEYEEPGRGTDWWKLTIVVMVVAMLLGVLTGCSHTKYVTVPEYHKEYIVRSDTIAKTDSVWQRDSVYVYHNGDSVVMNKVVCRDRVRNVYKVRTDTVCKTDSVPYPIEVEKELTEEEAGDLATGYAIRKAKWWILLAVVLAAIYEVAGWRRKKKES